MCESFLLLAALSFSPAQTHQGQDPESCTSILVGKLASTDGSTITSHSCDSGTDRTWMNMVPRQKHNTGDMTKVWVSLDVTEDARQFALEPYRNFGWKVSQDVVRDMPDSNLRNYYATPDPQSLGAVFNFPSSEHPDVAYRPMLVLWMGKNVSAGARKFMLYK